MTVCRLISRFVLDSTNNVLMVDYDGGGATAVTISLGGATEKAFYFSCHTTQSEDFSKALIDALEAAFPAGTWSVGIYGVNVSGAYADGRVRIYDANAKEYDLLFTHGSTTLDSRILGFDGSADESSSSSIIISDWVHRYGWYPQTVAMRDTTSERLNAQVAFGSDYTVDVVQWGGRRDTIELAFDFVHCPFMRTNAANDTNRNTGHNLTVGDLNCSLESFGLDLTETAHESAWRYYEDASNYNSTDYFKGPFTWPMMSELWQKPLALASIVQEAGEMWRLGLSGIEAEVS